MNKLLKWTIIGVVTAVVANKLIQRSSTLDAARVDTGDSGPEVIVSGDLTRGERLFADKAGRAAAKVGYAFSTVKNAFWANSEDEPEADTEAEVEK